MIRYFTYGFRMVFLCTLASFQAALAMSFKSFGDIIPYFRYYFASADYQKAKEHYLWARLRYVKSFFIKAEPVVDETASLSYQALFTSMLPSWVTCYLPYFLTLHPAVQCAIVLFVELVAMVFSQLLFK